MYSNLNRPTRFVRVALPAIAAAFFLQGNLPAQHFNFDTRYQTNGSSNRWQSPPPAVHAQPSPWNAGQQFPPGFHQLNSPAQTAMQFNPPISQPVQNQGMIQPAIVGSEYPTQIPMQVASPLAQPIHEIPLDTGVPMLPMESQIPALPLEANISSLPVESAVPATEIPLAPFVETELGSPAQLAQATPEGYDPSYPIEYPGADFQGYYPTDGEVIAPPSDTPLQGLPESIIGGSIIGGSTIGESASSTSDSQSSDEPQAPAIPSVVIEDPNPAIVVPDTATTSKPANNGSMSKAEPEIPTREPVTASVNNQARSDKMSAKMMAMEKAERDAEAKMIKKLKQQMRAAELRAREAEEKALAIARQSSSDQKKVDQLMAKLAKSNEDLDQMKSQAKKAKQQLGKARKDAAAAMQKDKRAKQQLDKARIASAAAEKARKDKAMAESAIELEPAAEPNKMKDTGKDSKKSPKANASNEKTLSEKIAALETARDKQLAAASVRLKKDFDGKIDEKLDAGKTDQHPEVLTLKEALKKRLNQSDKNIRGRYKRQINKLRKEAAARSRS